MRLLKLMGLGLLALVGVLVVVGLLLPSQWNVERSVVIHAEPRHVYPLVSDLKAWQSWAVWTKDMDPEVKNEYGGPAQGVGAWWAWDGPKMGHGKMTISKSEEAAGVWVEEMIETDESVNAKGSLTWKPEGGGLKVTWVDQGTLPPVVGGYFRSMLEEMLGDNFQKGLENLKAEAEKRRAAEEEAAKAAQAAQQAEPAAAPTEAPQASPATP
jgi:hypothetical protein